MALLIGRNPKEQTLNSSVGSLPNVFTLFCRLRGKWSTSYSFLKFLIFNGKAVLILVRNELDIAYDLCYCVAAFSALATVFLNELFLFREDTNLPSV